MHSAEMEENEGTLREEAGKDLSIPCERVPLPETSSQFQVVNCSGHLETDHTAPNGCSGAEEIDTLLKALSFAISEKSVANGESGKDFMQRLSNKATVKLIRELKQMDVDFNEIHGGDGDAELNKEYMRMSRHVVVRFHEVALESAYQEYFLSNRKLWGAFACTVLAVISLAVALAGFAPPYDKTVWWRRLSAFTVSFGMSLVVTISRFGGKFTNRFNDLLYDPLLCGLSLVAIFTLSMTSDRVAKHFDYPAKTWSLMTMQETNFNLWLGLIFAFMMMWLNLRLHWGFLTYVIGVPMSVGCMLNYGSLAFDLQKAAHEYHFDIDGRPTTDQLLSYELCMVVRALFFVVSATIAFISARRWEINDRYAFAKNYSLSQRIDRHRCLLEAQIASKENQIRKMQSLSLKSFSIPPDEELSKLIVPSRPELPRITIPPSLDVNGLGESALAQEILNSPTPNAKFAADLARCTANPEYLQSIADKLRDPSYSLQVFYADCQKGLPELLLCSGHETSFQQAVGSLFIAFWLLRLDMEGREGFCFGVDGAWNPNPKPADGYKSNPEGCIFGNLTEEQKRIHFFMDMEWTAVRDLVSQAGCGHQSSDVADNIMSLFSLLAMSNIMMNADYHPVVAAEHSPYHGYNCGSAIDNRAFALQYYLEYFPHLLPSFNRLPPTSQQILRLSISPGCHDFDLLSSIRGELPSGAKFSALKAAMTPDTSSTDVAMHILSWFVRLAAATGDTLGGAEYLMFNIPPAKLSNALHMVPHILKLPARTETEVDEDCLKATCNQLKLRDLCREDKSIVACMRIATLAKSDGAQFLECFGAIPQEEQHCIIEELSYTGVAGQFHRCRTHTLGGPAFILEGAPQFLQRYSGGREDICTTLLVLARLLRAARLAWPLEHDMQGTCVTLRLTSLAQQSLVGSGELRGILEPTSGEFWTLIGGKGATVGVLEFIRPARLNELKATGTHFQILDFHGIQNQTSEGSMKQVRPNLHGKWKCIDTFGMDDFLKAMGTGWVQRAAASKAPWPTWVFMQEDDHIAFINQSAMGDLREDIIVDGPEYVVIDGWKREIRCRASWNGNSLIILKSGPEGEFREIRTIDEGELLFKIQNAKDDAFPEWGRKFKRIS